MKYFRMNDSAPASRRPLLKQTWVRVLPGVLVTFACLWWAVDQMRNDESGGKRPVSEVVELVKHAFTDADYKTLPLMLVALVLFYWIKAVRWKLLLTPFGDFRPVRDLTPSVMTGFAFNNVLPAHLGEFVRVFVFSRQTGLPAATILTTVVLERLFDVIAILTLLMASLLTMNVQDMPPELTNAAWLFSGAVVAFLLIAAVYIIWTKPVSTFIEAVLRRIPFLPAGLSGKIITLMTTGAEGLNSLRSVRLLLGIGFTSLLQWILNGVIIYLALHAFDVTINAQVAGILLFAVAVSVTIPSTPGYFGVINVCFDMVLKLFSDAGSAVFIPASIYYHMAQWIPVTAVGMLLFLRTGFRLSDVNQAREKGPAAEAVTSPGEPDEATA